MEEEKVTILVDDRENPIIAEELIRLGAEVKVKRLDVGDFICSQRVCVEYKKAKDFIESITDGRLLSQAKLLKDNFERPVVVIEGGENMFSISNVHPNSIRGGLCSVILGYGIPVVNSKNARETAELLLAIARREQIKKDKNFKLHNIKKPAELSTAHEYVISALPRVGSATARELLRKFGSVSAVFSASEKELKEVKNIGRQKSKEIRRIIEENYENMKDL